MTRELYNTKIIQYNSNTFEVIYYRKAKFRRLGETDTTVSNTSKSPSEKELY